MMSHERSEVPVAAMPAGWANPCLPWFTERLVEAVVDTSGATSVGPECGSGGSRMGWLGRRQARSSAGGACSRDCSCNSRWRGSRSRWSIRRGCGSWLRLPGGPAARRWGRRKERRPGFIAGDARRSTVVVASVPADRDEARRALVPEAHSVNGAQMWVGSTGGGFSCLRATPRFRLAQEEMDRLALHGVGFRDPPVAEASPAPSRPSAATPPRQVVVGCFARQISIALPVPGAPAGPPPSASRSTTAGTSFCATASRRPRSARSAARPRPHRVSQQPPQTGERRPNEIADPKAGDLCESELVGTRAPAYHRGSIAATRMITPWR